MAGGVALTVVVAVGALTWWVVADGDGGGSGSGTTMGGPVVTPGVADAGDAAPDFELTTLEGGTVRLSGLRGTPVVLNFWASWCTPCRAEFPVLRAIHDEADGAFALVGVDTGDIRGDGRRFAREQRAGWPNGFDADGEVARGYGVVGLPQTFFIRADGTIAARVPAELDEARLRAQVARITGGS